jgi:hypothetical protein
MTDPSTGSGHSTLEILRRSHRALLDYEAAREARQGPRSEAGQSAVRKLAEAHRETWARAGGKPEDFLLARLLGLSEVEGLDGKAAPKAAPRAETQPQNPDAKPKGDEASGQDAPVPAEERPRGKSRKPALSSVEGEA